MLLYNDKIFDPNDSDHPQYEFYQEKLSELRLLYDRNTDENGNKRIVIKNKRGVRRNKITGVPEPISYFHLPYKTTKQGSDGLSGTWRYSKDAPVVDSFGNMRYSENGIRFGESVILNENEIDKAFYLIYITNEIGYDDDKGNYHAVVVDDKKEAVKLAKSKEEASDVEHFIFSKYSAFSAGKDGIDFLFKIARAWSVPKVDHLEKRYRYFVSQSQLDTAKTYIDVCKVELEKAVWKGKENGIPVEKFVEAVRKNPEWVDVKIQLLEVFEKGYVKCSNTGRVYLDVGGEETTICMVEPKKRSGDKFIDDAVYAIVGNEELTEILESLDESGGANVDKFNPAMFDPNSDSLDSLSYYDKKKLAKHIGITVKGNPKSDTLDKDIIDKFKEMDK